MRILIAIVITLTITGHLHAQSKFWNSPHDYLDQRPPSDTPQIFAPELLARRDTFAFDRVAWSDDGQTLYMEGGQRDSLYSQVWQTHRTAGGWTKPEIFLKEPYGLYDFMPTASGVCYVGSNQHAGKRRDFSDYDICTLNMRPGDTTVTTLGEPVNTPAFDGDFFVAR